MSIDVHVNTHDGGTETCPLALNELTRPPRPQGGPLTD